MKLLFSNAALTSLDSEYVHVIQEYDSSSIPRASHGCIMKAFHSKFWKPDLDLLKTFGPEADFSVEHLEEAKNIILSVSKIVMKERPERFK